MVHSVFSMILVIGGILLALPKAWLKAVGDIFLSISSVSPVDARKLHPKIAENSVVLSNKLFSNLPYLWKMEPHFDGCIFFSQHGVGWFNTTNLENWYTSMFFRWLNSTMVELFSTTRVVGLNLCQVSKFEGPRRLGFGSCCFWTEISKFKTNFGFNWNLKSPDPGDNSSWSNLTMILVVYIFFFIDIGFYSTGCQLMTNW